MPLLYLNKGALTVHGFIAKKRAGERKRQARDRQPQHHVAAKRETQMLKSLFPLMAMLVCSISANSATVNSSLQRTALAAFDQMLHSVELLPDFARPLAADSESRKRFHLGTVFGDYFLRNDIPGPITAENIDYFVIPSGPICHFPLLLDTLEIATIHILFDPDKGYRVFQWSSTESLEGAIVYSNRQRLVRQGYKIMQIVGRMPGGGFVAIKDSHIYYHNSGEWLLNGLPPTIKPTIMNDSLYDFNQVFPTLFRTLK